MAPPAARPLQQLRPRPSEGSEIIVSFHTALASWFASAIIQPDRRGFLGLQHRAGLNLPNLDAREDADFREEMGSEGA